MNIASLAGIMTGLGPIEQSGYTMAKWGTVALTRSLATSKPYLEKKEAIKGYALCPWFADTQLVRDMTNIDRLQKATKQRVRDNSSKSKKRPKKCCSSRCHHYAGFKSDEVVKKTRTALF